MPDAQEAAMWGNAMTIARIWGFEIKIDASWILIASLIVWSLATVHFPSELPDASRVTLVAAALVAMLGLFAGLILHELAHSVIARRLGVRVSGITLFLFGGVAELQNEPASGAREFWIALAGPVASLGVALGCWAAAVVTGLAGGPDSARVVLSWLAGLNLILALFNMLPAFPMDGGRVLRAWLWDRSGDLLAATRRAVAVSNLFAYGFMGLGVYAALVGGLASGLWPILIGLFVLTTARATLARLEADKALDGRRVGDLMTRDPWTAHPGMTLSHLVNRVFLDHGVSFVPVVEDGVLLGYVEARMLRNIDREHWATTTVNDVIESTSADNTVAPGLAATDLMALIIKTGRRKFLVAEAGQLAGVISMSDLLSYLAVFRDTAA